MRKLTFSFLIIVTISMFPLAVNAEEIVFSYPYVESADTIRKLSGVDVISNNDKTVKSSTPYHELDHHSMIVKGVNDIADALRRIPGVNIRDYGGAGGLKTVSIRGLGSQHTSVIYDGIALTDCQSGQIDLSRYSLENLSKVAVYSGDNDDIFLPARAVASASSLYLNTTALSDLNIGEPRLTLKLRGGSFGFINPYIRYSTYLNNNTTISGNLDYTHSNNNYPFKLRNVDIVTTERRENSKMDTWQSEVNLRTKLNNNGILTGKLFYFDGDRALPGAVKYYVSTSNEKLKERNFFGQLQFRKRLGNSVSFSSSGKFNWATTRYSDINGKYTDGIRNDYYIQRESYITGSLLITPSSNWQFNYSADGSWSTLSQFKSSAFNPRKLSVLQTAAARFSSNRLSIVGRILLSEYFNYSKTEESSRNESRFSPMMSVSFTPFLQSGLMLRGSYKNIFRVPTFNEAYFDNYGSINLRPETTDQFNLGLTYRNSAKWIINDMNFALDSYINHVRNKIVAVPYNMFLWTMSNVGKVRTIGIDVSGEVSLSLGSRHSGVLSGSYSLQKCKNRTLRGSVDWMKQVAYIPENSGSASVSWLNPWINSCISMTAMGSRFTNNTNIKETEIEGFTEFGFSIFRDIRIRNHNLNIRGEIMNLFNTQYEIVARYPMPGRSWRLTMSLDI